MSNINYHGMTTRSKSKNNGQVENVIKPDKNDKTTNKIIVEEIEEIDEHGNLKDFIVYDNDNDNDKKAMEELNKLLYRIKPIKNNKMKRKKNNDPLGNMFMNYLILKATEKANEELKKKENQS
jgi:hypothetical protein